MAETHKNPLAPPAIVAEARELHGMMMTKRAAESTALWQHIAKHSASLTAQPTRAFVCVEELAALALFLTTDAAVSITGTALSVDGGGTAQ